MYDVDLDHLTQTIDELAGVEDHLESLLAELRHRTTVLHLTWDGRSSAAHVLAQERWERGFAGMREALAAMRTAADSAHDNYSAAATANTRLWEQIR